MYAPPQLKGEALGRRTQHIKVPPVDHAGLFVEATKRAARRAGWPEAYREGTGLLIRLNRTKDAQENLARAMSEAVSAAAAKGVASDPSRATQQARTQALYSYHGDFWICTLQEAPPAHAMDGDEYYSPQDVREIVEGISARRFDG